MIDNEFVRRRMKDSPLAIFNEHCIRAGQRCGDEDLIERKSDDIYIYEGWTPGELRISAEQLFEQHPYNLYQRRIASTIFEYLTGIGALDDESVDTPDEP